MKESNKIKVLHVVGPMNMGGTETMLMNIYRNIDKSKVQFDFISYSQEEAYYDEEIKKMGGKVIKLPKTQSINDLCRAIKKYGPYHVVHAHTLFHCGIAMIAAKKCGVGTRISHAHTTLDNSEGIVRKVYINLMRKVINLLSTELLYCSKEAGRYLYGEKKIENNKCKYYPNVIDYSKFITNKKEEVTKFKEEVNMKSEMVIGHIGTFKESKNQKFLIKILKVMIDNDIDANLMLVGDGGMKKEIEGMARKYNLYDKVRFVGIRNDIDLVLQSMDVFVFPSIYEGLGLVLLEAQASNVPCVVSEAIQEEADLHLGLFRKLNLKDDIVTWIQNILEAKEQRRIINKEDIIKTFESSGYSVHKGVQRLMDIYNIK